MTVTVTDIQRFCMHDGFGIRTTIFLQGCPLRCFWCHNPETCKASPQLMYRQDRCIGCGGCAVCAQDAHIFDPDHRLRRERCQSCGQCAAICPTEALRMSGREMHAQQIIEEVLRDRAFYGEDGGMTLSGGEPMLHAEKCIALLRLAKSYGINTAVETCGYFDARYVKPLCEVADCLLWDIKDTDDTRHRANTGVSNARILENLFSADAYNVPIILRCILLQGVNADEAHLQNVKRIYKSLKNAVRVDFLPCHSLGNAKGEALGEEIADLTSYAPSREYLAFAKEFMKG